MKPTKLAKYREFLLIILAVLMFFVSPLLIRMIDDTAGAYDVGILQIPIVAVMMFFFYSFTSWITINLIWPDLGNFFNDSFSKIFKELSPWQSIKLSVGLLCFFLLMLVLLSRTM